MFKNDFRTLAFGILFIIFSISWGIFSSHESKNKLDSEMRAQLIRKVEDLAAAINPELVKSLSFTLADKENKNFQLIRRQMIAYSKFIHQRIIYSMILRNGEIIFGPENLAENDSIASPPGTKYEEPPEIVWQVFKDKKSATFGPYTDEYGTFVSALAPVFDQQTGEILLVTGLDILANDWYTKISSASYVPIYFSLSLVLCIICGIILIIRRENKPKDKVAWEKHIEAAMVFFCGIIITASVTLNSVETFVHETNKNFQYKLDLPSRLIQHEIRNPTSAEQSEKVVGQTLLRSYSNLSDFDLSLVDISDPEKLVPLKTWRRGHEIENNVISNGPSNRIIPVFGTEKTFALVFNPDQERNFSIWRINLLLPLCSGIILSFLSAYFTWFFRNNQIDLEMTINEKTSELREREEDLKVTLYSIGDAVIATNAEGCVTRMNLVAEQLTGWKSEDAFQKPLDEVFRIINTQTRETLSNPVKKVLETGNIIGLANDTALISRDGTERRIGDSAAPIKNSSGIIKGVILVFRDISQEYIFQRDLRESEQQFRTIFNSLAVGVSIIDSETMQILKINKTAEQMIGLHADDIVGKVCHSFICPAEKNKCPVKDLGQTVDHSEKKLLTSDGSEKMILKSVVPINFDGKKCFLESFIDISAENASRLRLEEALKNAEEKLKNA
ncbi:MAG: PAS domain S-box protein [Candidatus Riflebacteria bacterium]|nr:PAS domain S-box protein [Candidatus Riflebacteria bacterium]